VRAGRAAAAVIAAGALAAGAVIVRGALSAGAPGAAADGRPRIVVEPQGFDFGSVLPGKTLQKEVAVRNHGDADLVIAKVDTTCSCTVVGSYARRIPPGSGTALRVELTTPYTPGPAAQAVRIHSNDPEQPQVHVDVTATVVAPAKTR
jgi:hypothetical protein